MSGKRVAGKITDHAARRWGGVGLDEYGPFNPFADNRDFGREIQDELADAWNYARCRYQIDLYQRGKRRPIKLWMTRLVLRLAWMMS